MTKRRNDGVRRMLVQAYVDQNIAFNAAKKGLTNAEFIEYLFQKAKDDSVSDDLTLQEKERIRDELDIKLRALGAVIAQEKEDAVKSASAAQAEAMAEAANALAVQKKALEDGEWVQAQQWFNTLLKDEKDRIGWFRKSIIPAWKEFSKPVIVDAHG